MHIAAAMSTPVIVVFGPSRVSNWGPWNNSETGSSQKNGLQISGIHTDIQRDWECIPCGEDECDSSKHSKCIEDIKPDEIKDIFFKKLKRIKNSLMLTVPCGKVMDNIGIKYVT
jgi:heptosyltransferase-3